jgi:excisionase family DNA binding protein
MAMARTRSRPEIPTEHEQRLAREAAAALATPRVGDVRLRVQVSKDGREATVDLPAAVVRLLGEMLKEMGAGNAVAVVPVEAEVSTQQAADLLNVSRPYVVGLIDKGVLPARMVGTQRRLPLKDVLIYQAEQHAKRLEALAELSALDQELGLR